LNHFVVCDAFSFKEEKKIDRRLLVVFTCDTDGQREKRAVKGEKKEI